MDESIFTKIIKGEIPSYKIYEDEKVFAILDIDPLSDGHTLLFPKKQVDSLWDLDGDDYQYLMKIAQELSLKIQQKMSPIRVGMIVEGFGVPHAHIHLVPLYDKNVLQLHHGYPVNKSRESFTEITRILTE